MVRLRTLIMLGAVWLPVLAVPARAGELDGPTGYLPPVDAPVIDPFRPPTHVGGTGNRGLEYRTAPGSPVFAAKDGQVTFAGPVAGSLYVTVAHADGLRTSYSYLADVLVKEGQFVTRGQQLGATGATFHFGARDGVDYIDPALLFGEGPRRARLVPIASGSSPSANPPQAAAARIDWVRESEVQPNPWREPMRLLRDLAIHFGSASA